MPGQSSIADSAKQRSLRVPLDYYRRVDGLTRIKLVASALVAGAAAVYVFWLAAAGSPARRHLSAGPLASVHSAWNDDCNACHQDFRPLRADAVDWRSLLTSASGSHTASDQACTKCHNEPAHHVAARPDEVPSCAACHHEHRGSAAEIRRAADFHCLACHEDLAVHRTVASGLNPPASNVNAFATGPSSQSPRHPDFRSLADDPGNIKFNHWLHLQPGIAPPDAKHKLQAAALGDSTHYGKYQDAAGLVQLDCTACHEPDSAGRQMRRIAYDQHCAACHPLTTSLNTEKTATVPHGLSAPRLTEVIDGLLFATERENPNPNPTTPNTDETVDLPLIPGRTLGNNLAQKIQQDILGKRSTVLAAIGAKCTQCHYPAVQETPGSKEIAELAPANIPASWFEHARFDHSAHRHVDCRSCHQAAYAFEQRDKPRFVVPGSSESSLAAAARDDEQVMIAGIDACVTCHAPRRGSSGGARHDCSECHEYHGRDVHGSRSLSNSLAPRIALASVALPDRSQTPQVGVSSCASAGCHGSDTLSPAWQSAFTVWAARDPHTKAFDVLWTARAREMTRNLARDREPLTDVTHSSALESRCIGCHASSATEDHSFGVHCESCHGGAAGWLHTHYRAGFAHAASSGFTNTKDLRSRAAACLPCHVGPAEGGGNRQIVDHDLIAAGHPRLAFEYRTYLESLPAHWDDHAEVARRPGDHHFQTWLAGYAAQITAQDGLTENSATVDFSQLDCFGCHQGLTGGDGRRSAGPKTLVPNRLPLGGLAALRSDGSATLRERLAFARGVLTWATDQPSWDGSVQSYLAIRAIAADLATTNDPSNLAGPLKSLGRYLSNDCFAGVIPAGRRPTIYDSPSQFAPDALAEKLRPLMEAIEAVQGEPRSRVP